MICECRTVALRTRGDGEVLELTPAVRKIVKDAGLQEGLVTVFVPGSTAAVTTTEFEPGLRKDLPEFFERLAPAGGRYHHDATWGDGNGHAHVRASLVGPGLTVPVTAGAMTLGTWQNIVLLDFDNRPRERTIMVQLLGR